MAELFGDNRKKCCCGEGCTGCCFPADLSPIPFAIDAPGCDDLDGYTDNLVEEAVDPTQHACGICGSYVLSTAFSVPGQFWNPDGMGGCDLIPACAITFCVRLICDGDAHGELDTPGGGECCKKLRLLVAVPYEFEGGIEGDGGLGCLGGVNLWHDYVAPSSCSCEGGLSAIFPLGRFVPKATDDTCPPGPLVQPCVPDCDMSTISLVI